MRYRNRIEIISQILETANAGYGVTKTKIMYMGFLSSSQLKEYLKILTDNSLLSYDFATGRFRTTEKGHRFIEAYNGLDNVMKEEVEEQQLQLQQLEQQQIDIEGGKEIRQK